MRELLTHLPIVGTCGVIALLAGPLARLPIDLGAWLLKWLCRPTRAGDARQAALRDSDNGITRWRTAVRKRSAGRSKNVAARSPQATTRPPRRRWSAPPGWRPGHGAGVERLSAGSSPGPSR